MKNLILGTLVFLSSVSVFAKEFSLEKTKTLLPALERTGVEGTDYTCGVKTEWLANGDLKIVATSTYKDWAPHVIEVVYKNEKQAATFTEEFDGEIRYTVSQSTLLLQEGDYEVYFYENFSFDLDSQGELASFAMQVAEVDYESDPREDVIYCNLTK